MAETFFTDGGMPRARAWIRRDASEQPQSLDQAIPDGDTIGVHLQGSGLVRFLGIDTPEKKFELPGSREALPLDAPAWEAYLSDPFLPQFGPYPIDPELEAHLRTRVGAGAGINHRLHGDRAEQALTALVESDMSVLGQDGRSFRFFLAFSFEIFDTFGRFLAFINRHQPQANSPAPRPLSYNERMLERGAALPYFIWPNIDPYRSMPILDAVLVPGSASQIASSTPALRRARDFVRQARTDGIGVFDPVDPLRFEAFEVRYLGRRELPNRAVIDLSRDDDVILRPQSYFRIANPEDRLFIPPAFVPLFVSRGWKLEGW